MGINSLPFFLLVVCCCFQTLIAQTALPDCGVPYIDPQDSDLSNGLARDTLVYATYFENDQQQRAYFIDINAFGGQQVDKAIVYAILPDSTRKPIGQLSFGNCASCVRGFAFVLNDSLMVADVRSSSEMSLWLESFGQPSFSLTGNLQTLAGVGRISGTLPFCAIGMEVEYDIYNNLANTTTEFATQIICPVVVRPCAIALSATPDCNANQLQLEATLPNDCFSSDAKVRWFSAVGWESRASKASLPFRGNEGWYYFEVEETCCKIIDSVWVEAIDFASSSSDWSSCVGEDATLEGFGGIRQFWTLPNGERYEGSMLEIVNATPVNEGNYIFQAFDENGCEDTTQVFLQIIIPEVPQIQVSNTCLGDTVHFFLLNDSAFVQAAWQSPAGMVLEQPVIFDLQISDFGTYLLKAKDNFGCGVEQSFEVAGSKPPEVEVALEPICDTIKIRLSPDSLFYQWETGVTGSTFATTEAGNYRVEVKALNGCKSVLIVEVPRADTIGFEVIVEHPACPNDPTGSIEIVTNTPDLPMIFSIDGGEEYYLSPRFEQLFGGNYQVVVQDELGCIKTKSVKIETPDTLAIKILIDSALVVRPNTSIQLNTAPIGAIKKFQWLPESINQDAPTVSFLATENMDIRVVVEDERGCLASDGVSLTIELGEIYIPNIFSPDFDGANDFFTLFSEGTSGEIIAQLHIFDRWGTLVFEAKEIPLNQSKLGWDGKYLNKPLENGIFTYHAIVRFGNNTTKTFKGDVTLTRK